MFYESAIKAAKVTVGFAIGATLLWLVAVPVTEGWLQDWLIQPPPYIPRWRRLLVSFARGWTIVWPAVLPFVWVFSLLNIELWSRTKARRR